MADVPNGVEIRGERSPAGRSPATRGRGLFATKSFSPGSLIALFDKPLVVLPSSKEAPATCNYCLDIRRTSVKLCSGCHGIVYCSAACQRAHWTRFHKFECKPIKMALEDAARNLAAKRKDNVAAAGTSSSIPRSEIIDNIKVPTPVRALMLLLQQWEKAGTTGASAGVRRAIEQLESNTSAFINNRAMWDDFKLQAAAACKFLGWFSEEKIKTALQIMCCLHTNSFDRTESDTDTSGIYLDATLAMVNHSCLPSAVVAFSGQKAYLRAEQPIAKGDEITISYIDYTKPRATRQRGLTLYNFTCTCRRCTEDLDVYQVCRSLATSRTTSEMVKLNSVLSFVPDVNLLRNPPPLSSPASGAAAAPTPEQVQAMYDESKIDTFAINEANQLEFLRHLWVTCQPLVRAKRWAIEPLASLVRQTLIYYSMIGNNAHALALACFCMQHIDPYKYPAPFAAWRLKGLLLAGKLIPHIVPVAFPAFPFDGGKVAREARGTEPGADPQLKVHPGVLAVLPDLADGSFYGALLLIIIGQGPKAHSDEWLMIDTARVMLEDFKSRPEHGQVMRMLTHWYNDPASPPLKSFFNKLILTPVSKVSAFAPEILEGLLK